jgi:catechol 2,3-dioxygenase-like lactoylglutathione lyase family enzyme
MSANITMTDMSAPRLDVVGVIVSDMDESVAFYRRLGVQFPEPHDPEGHGHVEATLEGGIRFALDTEDTIRSFDPDWIPPSRGHRMAVAFLCESPAAVNQKFAELVKSGARPRKEPWDAFWGQRYAQIHDPDGNVVDLFAPIPQ